MRGEECVERAPFWRRLPRLLLLVDALYAEAHRRRHRRPGRRRRFPLRRLVVRVAWRRLLLGNGELLTGLGQSGEIAARLVAHAERRGGGGENASRDAHLLLRVALYAEHVLAVAPGKEQCYSAGGSGGAVGGVN